MRRRRAFLAIFMWLLATSPALAATAKTSWLCRLTFILASGRPPLSGNFAIGGPGLFRCSDERGAQLRIPVWLKVDVEILEAAAGPRSFNIRGHAESIRVVGSPTQALLGSYAIADANRLVITGATTPVTWRGGQGQPSLRALLKINGTPGTKLSLGPVLIKRESAN